MTSMESKRHALGLLIDAIKRSRRYSDEDIARRARERGHEMSKSNISRIRNEPVESINPSQMRALADGMGLPVEHVLQAALASMGLPVGEAPSRFEDVVKGDPNLIPEARDHLLAQYALLLRIAGSPATNIRQRELTEAELDAAQDEVIDAALDAEVPPPRPIRPGGPKRKGG